MIFILKLNYSYILMNEMSVKVFKLQNLLNLSFRNKDELQEELIKVFSVYQMSIFLLKYVMSLSIS